MDLPQEQNVRVEILKHVHNHQFYSLLVILDGKHFRPYHSQLENDFGHT